ncbi:unnamed protein product [Moneuplotes crassus]|uniref:Methyltransferase type 11 domain-containing protein n=1 Tax=Euplotes crassus TaxID=5936 RepID=A0AAD2D117_EUPCR|nr:unnamed protein product [Moneuplotes crassus]
MDHQEHFNRNDKAWGSIAEKYESVLENTTIQSSVTLYSLTNAKDAERICEVAVGPGQASRMFVSSIMKKGASYFASDIADGMNERFTKGFQDSDLASNPKVGYEWVETEEEVDVAGQAGKELRGVDRKVFHLKANNEKLPYASEVFDCYLASLSLNLVNNHKNQISESYRVLQKGGVAGFTVLGRQEKCNYITIIPEVIESLGHILSAPKDRPHPTYLADRKKIEKDFKEAGFSSVKSYYTNKLNFERCVRPFQIYGCCTCDRGILWRP